MEAKEAVMTKDYLVEFGREEVHRLDHEKALARFGELYRDMKTANSVNCMEGVPAKFDLHYLFADILDCLDLLSFNNLSKVIGIVNAGKIWQNVKNQRE